MIAPPICTGIIRQEDLSTLILRSLELAVRLNGFKSFLSRLSS